MTRPNADRDRHDIRHTLVPAAASLASASFAPGSGWGTGPVDSGLERPLEREVGGLGPDLALGKQAVENVGRGSAPGPVELDHRLDVGRGAGHHALSRDRLDERPLEYVALDRRGSHHVTAD